MLRDDAACLCFFGCCSSGVVSELNHSFVLLRVLVLSFVQTSPAVGVTLSSVVKDEDCVVHFWS